jgi:hypothetical protein
MSDDTPTSGRRRFGDSPQLARALAELRRDLQPGEDPLFWDPTKGRRPLTKEERARALDRARQGASPDTLPDAAACTEGEPAQGLERALEPVSPARPESGKMESGKMVAAVKTAAPAAPADENSKADENNDPAHKTTLRFPDEQARRSESARPVAPPSDQATPPARRSSLPVPAATAQQESKPESQAVRLDSGQSAGSGQLSERTAATPSVPATTSSQSARRPVESVRPNAATPPSARWRTTAPASVHPPAATSAPAKSAPLPAPATSPGLQSAPSKPSPERAHATAGLQSAPGTSELESARPTAVGLGSAPVGAADPERGQGTTLRLEPAPLNPLRLEPASADTLRLDPAPIDTLRLEPAAPEPRFDASSGEPRLHELGGKPALRLEGSSQAEARARRASPDDLEPMRIERPRREPLRVSLPARKRVKASSGAAEQDGLPTVAPLRPVQLRRWAYRAVGALGSRAAVVVAASIFLLAMIVLWLRASRRSDEGAVLDAEPRGETPARAAGAEPPSWQPTAAEPAHGRSPSPETAPAPVATVPPANFGATPAEPGRTGDMAAERRGAGSTAPTSRPSSPSGAKSSVTSPSPHQPKASPWPTEERRF